MTSVDSGSRTRNLFVSVAPWATSLVATVVAVACSSSPGGGPTSTGTGGSSSSGGGASSTTTHVSSPSASSSGSGEGGGGGASDLPGLPCDVLGVLQANCTSCHGNPTKFKAPMPLLNYADLTAESLIDPTMTFAERCVVRMQKAASPMPPAIGVTMTKAQIAAFTTWIQAGYPMGECDPSDAGPTPEDAGDAAEEPQ